jgi:predicted transcriptional regulator
MAKETNKEQITIRLHPDTLNELDEVKNAMHFSRADVIQLALSDFFKKRKAENREPQSRP